MTRGQKVAKQRQQSDQPVHHTTCRRNGKAKKAREEDIRATSTGASISSCTSIFTCTAMAAFACVALEFGCRDCCDCHDCHTMCKREGWTILVVCNNIGPRWDRDRGVMG